MRNILILTGDTGSPIESGRTGALFDQALIEVVRVLDGSLGATSVLVPWSAELAPLIAAATIDTNPSFDPEGEDSRKPSRPGLIPYLLPDEGRLEESMLFFRASYLSLEREAPMDFATALAQYPPNDVVVLNWTSELRRLRDALRRAQTFATFGSLTSAERIRTDLGVQSSQVRDLEQSLPPFDPKSEVPPGSEFADERDRDDGLEPFIPFGLLIQHHFDQIIPDSEVGPPRGRR